VLFLRGILELYIYNLLFCHHIFFYYRLILSSFFFLKIILFFYKWLNGRVKNYFLYNFNHVIKCDTYII